MRGGYHASNADIRNIRSQWYVPMLCASQCCQDQGQKSTELMTSECVMQGRQCLSASDASFHRAAFSQSIEVWFTPARGLPHAEHEAGLVSIVQTECSKIPLYPGDRLSQTHRGMSSGPVARPHWTAYHFGESHHCSFIHFPSCLRGKLFQLRRPL